MHNGKHNAATRESSHRAKYERQKVRTAKNKDRARKKHLVLHPNDRQNAKRLAELGYKRGI